MPPCYRSLADTDEQRLGHCRADVLSILCQEMSRTRHGARIDLVADRRSPISAFTRDYPAGHVVAPHFHDRDQLVYASRGVMTVRSRHETWVVPTHRAVWIPARFPHEIAMSGFVAMRALYLRPGLAGTLPRRCCVVNVSPLLRELILHACTIGALRRSVSSQRHLMDAIIDQLKWIPSVPLQLPLPSDARARRIAALLLANPSERRSLRHLGAHIGASTRTLERLFQQEVGMSPGKWRQQLRLMQALRLLADGVKVTEAALGAGYSTPSAFISMFRRALGTTPASYFRSA
jgi:AraC-like DNA-binding protein